MTIETSLISRSGGQCELCAAAQADNPQHIEGRVDGQQIVLLTQFVKKSS